MLSWPPNSTDQIFSSAFHKVRTTLEFVTMKKKMAMNTLHNEHMETEIQHYRLIASIVQLLSYQLMNTV